MTRSLPGFFAFSLMKVASAAPLIMTPSNHLEWLGPRKFGQSIGVMSCSWHSFSFSSSSFNVYTCFCLSSYQTMYLLPTLLAILIMTSALRAPCRETHPSPESSLLLVVPRSWLYCPAEYASGQHITQKGKCRRFLAEAGIFITETGRSVSSEASGETFMRRGRA